MLVFARAIAIVALIGLLFSLPSIPSKYIYYGRRCGRNARIPKPIPPCHDWHVELPEPSFPCMKCFEIVLCIWWCRRCRCQSGQDATWPSPGDPEISSPHFQLLDCRQYNKRCLRPPYSPETRPTSILVQSLRVAVSVVILNELCTNHLCIFLSFCSSFAQCR
jgi:hypothetical protein